MALRLRRGLDIERQSAIFAEGEPIYTTDTKKIHIGDGSTPGGLLVSGLLSLNDDPTPRLGGNFDLNSNDIVGAGNINIVGDITVTGIFSAGFIEADYRGSLFASDSSVIVDGNSKTLHGSLKDDGGVLMFDAFTGRFNLSNNTLSSLSDVAGASTVGDFLTWDGVGWEGKTFGTAIDGTNPAPYAIAQYNPFNGWVSDSAIYNNDSTVAFDLNTGYVNISTQSISTLADIFIDLNNLAPDDVLSWDGTVWTHKQVTLSNFAIVLNDIDDVNAPSPSINDVLTYDGSGWSSQPIPSTTVNLALDEIDDVLTTGAVTNNVLTYDGVNWVPQAISLNVELNDLVDTDISSSTLAADDVLKWNGFSWVNTPDSFNPDDIVTLITTTTFDNITVENGDFTNVITGHVEADSISTTGLTVNIGDFTNVNTTHVETDSINSNTVVTGIAIINEVNAPDNRFSINGPSGTPFQITAEADENHATFKCIRSSVNDLSSDIGVNGRLIFSRNDTTNGELSTGLIYSSNDYIRLSSSAGGTFTPAETIALENAGGSLKVGIGTVTPAETLHVAGSGKYDSFIQFGSLSTVERDALTPANGMVIYNTTVDKFQGYAGGAWVDLS